jgi:hypothetical protein
MFCLPSLGRGWRALTAALLLAGAFTASELTAQPLGGGCERATFSRRPGWTTSGAWSKDGQLLIVDALYNRILSYTKAGRKTEALPEATTAAMADFFPAGLKAQEGNLLLELAHERLVELSTTYAPGRIRNLRQESASPGGQMVSMYLWDVAGNDLITVSDVAGPNKLAVLRMPLDKPNRFTILEPLPRGLDESGNIFRLGHPYIATLGTTGYVLVPGVGIFRNEPGSSVLEPLGVRLPGPTDPPNLPIFRNFDDFPVTMAAVERTAMPTGLYAWSDHLWVVSRFPQNGGKTSWLLTKIDPQRPTVLGTAELPLRANHVVVVPGSPHWAILEKGPVEQIGRQSIATMVLMPATQFAGTLPNIACAP